MDNATELGLKEFFNGLRIAFGNGATYSAQHPVFLKSTEELKKKIDTVLVAFRSVEVLISPRYLLIDDMKFEKDKLYEELAHLLHIRSIKSIKLERGVDLEELKYFISKACLQPRKILEEGGITQILKNKNIQRISAEMLDYSEILKSTKEDKDVWAFLLRRALDSNNLKEIDALVNSFERMLRSVATQDLLDEGEFRTAVEDFLLKLQERNEKAFIQCAEILLHTLIRYLEAAGTIALPERIKSHLQSLNAADLANILLKELLIADNAKFTILKLYGQFLEIEHHEAIAVFLANKIEERISPQINLKWLEKILALFNESDQDLITQCYAPVILRYKKIFAQEDIFPFNQNALPLHYRTALINLFAQEQHAEWLSFIVENLLAEWKDIPEKEKIKYYENLLEVRGRKRKPGSVLEPILQKIDNFIAHYLEQCVLAGQDSTELETFLGLFKEGTLKSDVYLDKIFKENDLRPIVLKVFFTFYPNGPALFTERLKGKLSDTQFLLKLIESLKKIPDPLALEILKSIFPCHNTYVKISLLKKMQDLSVYDKNFLMAVLSNRTSVLSIRELALEALLRDKQAQKEAARILLSPSGPFGKNKALLIENIGIVRKTDLKEAAEHLVELRKRAFLWWNKDVSHEASQVLEQWHYGKN